MPVAPATIQSANRIPLVRGLGIHLVEIGERHAVMRVKVGAAHGNYYGGVHGGLIATLADTVLFFSRPLLPSGLAVTTANLNVSYVRAPAMGDVLSARSELLHLGRRTASLTVRIHDQERRLVAHGTGTLLVLDPPAPPRSRKPPPRRRRARA